MKTGYLRHLTLLAGLLVSLSASAGKPTDEPPIEVDAVDPPSGVQGQLMQVKVVGNGFGAGDSVHFLIAGGKDDSQILVGPATFIDNDPDYPGFDTLTTDIEILATASVTDYDVEVRAGRGRKGKGTTLFKVQAGLGSPGSGNSELMAKFCLHLTELDPGLASDGDTVYCDSKKTKVMVATGSGPGFRFATNASGNTPRRLVRINVPGGSVEIKDNDGTLLTVLSSGYYDTDLRFNKTDQDGGLDLGAMLPGETDYVPIDLSFESPDGVHRYGLAWGENSAPFSHGYLFENPCIANNGLDAQVTRDPDDSGKWRIRSNPANSEACLWLINDASLDGNQDGTVVSMPFDFTIYIK